MSTALLERAARIVSRDRAEGAFRSTKFRVAIMVGLLALLAACGSSSSDAEHGGRLRIGDQNKLLRRALEVSGQSKDMEQSIEWTTFADGPHMNAAFIADAIDVGWMGDTPTLLASAARADIVILTSRALPANSYLGIIARPGSGISRLQDLRGKRVAFTRGTASQGFLALALDRVCLKQGDIKVIDVPGVSVGNTLDSGSADAAVLAGPILTNYLVAHPDAVELKAVDPEYLVLVATRKALADPAKRAKIENFVVREQRAGQWILGHPRAWQQAYFGRELRQSDAAIALLDKRAVTLILVGPVDDGVVNALRRQHRLLAETGLLPSGQDLVGPLFDASINRRFNHLIAENAR